jgi:hypothetical protein
VGVGASRLLFAMSRDGAVTGGWPGCPAATGAERGAARGLGCYAAYLGVLALIGGDERADPATAA